MIFPENKPRYSVGDVVYLNFYNNCNIYEIISETVVWDLNERVSDVKNRLR